MLRTIISKIRAPKTGQNMFRQTSGVTQGTQSSSSSGDSGARDPSWFKRQSYFSSLFGAIGLSFLAAHNSRNGLSWGRFGLPTADRNRVENRYSETEYPANKPIEDRCAINNLANVDGFVATVFDGHGGFQCSEWAKTTLHSYIDEEFAKLGKSRGFTLEEVTQVMEAAFTRVEIQYKEVALLAYNFDFPGMAYCGAVVLTSLVIDNKLYTANIGDCRAVLITENDDGTMSATKLNRNMSSCSKRERAIMQAAFPDDKDIIVERRPGAWYVKGRLMPTKALGDLHLKHEEFNLPSQSSRMKYRKNIKNWNGPYITHIPEVKEFDLTSGSRALVLGTDGLWDEMKAGEVAKKYEDRVQTLSREEFGESLLQDALVSAANVEKMTIEEMKALKQGDARRNVHDDITVVVVDLENQFLADRS